MSFLPLTPANFEDYKKDIIMMIDAVEFDELDPDFEMNLKNGVIMGNHANECDTCNIYHYLMSIIIDTHRKKLGK